MGVPTGGGAGGEGGVGSGCGAQPASKIKATAMSVTLRTIFSFSCRARSLSPRRQVTQHI